LQREPERRPFAKELLKTPFVVQSLTRDSAKVRAPLLALQADM
jgi:hypothetical protein